LLFINDAVVLLFHDLAHHVLLRVDVLYFHLRICYNNEVFNQDGEVIVDHHKVLHGLLFGELKQQIGIHINIHVGDLVHLSLQDLCLNKDLAFVQHSEYVESETYEDRLVAYFEVEHRNFVDAGIEVSHALFVLRILASNHNARSVVTQGVLILGEVAHGLMTLFVVVGRHRSRVYL
jgi:hypothetical protein